MGRKPVGPKLAQRVEASPEAKRRLEVVLETITGGMTMEQACQALDLKKSMLFNLRQCALQAAAASLEAQRIGRPPLGPAGEEAGRIAESEAEVRRLRTELKAAEIRVELGLALPHRSGKEAPAQKKNESPCEAASKSFTGPMPLTSATNLEVALASTPVVESPDARLLSSRGPLTAEFASIEHAPAFLEDGSNGSAVEVVAAEATVREQVLPEAAVAHLPQAGRCLADPPTESLEPAGPRQGPEQVERLRACVAARLGAAGAPAWRRPSSFQEPRRQAEQDARRRAAGFCRWARQAGLSTAEAAKTLGVPRRTLAHWTLDRRPETSTPKWRGRRRASSPPEQQEAVLNLLQLTGPQIGIESLRALFPDMNLVELRRLRRQYREQTPPRKRSGRRLLWSGAGRVWAVDFVDWSRRGAIRQVLSVRDMATRRQLLWRPLPSQEASHVVAALRDLIALHSAPLVLKRDNGSPFTAHQTREELAAQRVAELPSPVDCPSYNGICERGNRTMEEFTSAQAAAAGRAGQWQEIDLQKALALANQVTRPWGRHGPTPDEAWEGRSPIGAEERQRFEETFARHRAAVADKLGYTPDKKLTARQQDLRDRRALSLTLQELGYVTVCDRRDPRLKRPPGEPTPVPDVASPPAEPATTTAGPTGAAVLDAEPGRLDALSAPLDATPGELPGIELVSPAALLAVASALEENSKSAPAGLLASETACTLEAGSKHEAPPRVDPQQVHSAHGEPGMFRFLRRPFTPLLNALKVAKIM